jgi:catechol 2,3-dioxygenase-like lactoylglutathione lyase family enzyme
MDWKLEVVILPVADVDRAKRFYTEQVGFSLDTDFQPNEHFRVVQMTPPGSACSVTLGIGIGDVPPGYARGMHLVVSDIAQACEELSSRGVEVSPIHHFVNGEQRPGPHPEHENYNSFSSFADPDGNTWILQERRK